MMQPKPRTWQGNYIRLEGDSEYKDICPFIWNNLRFRKQSSTLFPYTRCSKNFSKYFVFHGGFNQQTYFYISQLFPREYSTPLQFHDNDSYTNSKMRTIL
jgi:hypothetical protein